MLHLLPDRRSKRWLFVGMLYVLIIWGILLVNRYLVLTTSVNFVLSMRLLLLSLLLSTIVNGAGWLGTRWIWLGSTIGIFAGLSLMFLHASQHTGWEDLIGFLSFLMCSIIGLGAGIFVEAAIMLYRHLRRR